jgi:hypothetical protein
MYVQRHIEAPSYHHCCSVKAVLHADCAVIAIGIYHEMYMRHIAFCGLSGSTIISHVISQMTRFSRKKY